MENCPAKCWLVAAAVLLLAASLASAADNTGDLISNGSFEAGMQIWKGDGKIVLLPDGNRVCEIDASKSRMKEIRQEFHLKQLQQVEVLFRARAIKYTGAGIRIAIHQPGAGAMIYNKDLPADGSWGNFRILYTRAVSNTDIRELKISTLIGTGQVQIDDVEVREPSKVVEEQPRTLPAATPAPVAKLAPSLPPVAPVKPAPPLPPVALVKPPAPPPTPAPVAPPVAASAPPNVPAGTFGSPEQVLSSVPAEAIRKLQDNATVEAGIAEVNEYLARNVKNKPALFRIDVSVSEPVASTQNKYRIRARDHAVMSWNGGAMNGHTWAYFPEATVPAEGKAAVGSQVIASGVIGRCDITNKGRLQLNIDLQKAKVEGP
jgi:hypothetical protein